MPRHCIPECTLTKASCIAISTLPEDQLLAPDRGRQASCIGEADGTPLLEIVHQLMFKASSNSCFCGHHAADGTTINTNLEFCGQQSRMTS